MTLRNESHVRLDTTYGIMLLQPAFRSYRVELGEISSYLPGYKENAGIFHHNNSWIAIAETMVGRPERLRVLQEDRARLGR